MSRSRSPDSTRRFKDLQSCPAIRALSGKGGPASLTDDYTEICTFGQMSPMLQGCDRQAVALGGNADLNGPQRPAPQAIPRARAAPGIARHFRLQRMASTLTMASIRSSPSVPTWHGASARSAESAPGKWLPEEFGVPDRAHQRLEIVVVAIGQQVVGASKCNECCAFP